METEQQPRPSMPFVHSVFTFRKPSETAELGEVLQRLEALPGSAASGEPAGHGYLDRFRPGDEVTLSLVSPTGKSARVHAGLIVGLIEASGETARVSSSVIVEPKPKLEVEATARAMTSEQLQGRIHRARQEVPVTEVILHVGKAELAGLPGLPGPKA